MLIRDDNTSPHQKPGVVLVAAAAAAGGSFTFIFFETFRLFLVSHHVKF